MLWILFWNGTALPIYIGTDLDICQTDQALMNILHRFYIVYRTDFTWQLYFLSQHKD